MTVREPELRRAASRVVKALIAADLVENGEKPEALERRVFDAFQHNMKEEAALDRDAEKMLADLSRQSAGMDQRKLLQKIKEKLAKERNFVL